MVGLLFLGACSQHPGPSQQDAQPLPSPGVVGTHQCRSVSPFLGRSIGNGQCVDFVLTCSGAPHTRHWKPGAALYQTQGGKARALHQNRIDAGTLIATFEHGKYPNRRGHHAAVYISHDDRGIWVYDQCLGKATSKRFIRVRYDEAYPSNTAQRYHIIKTHH